MRARIYKSIAKGGINAPPSKSYAHRILICSALAGKASTVNGILDSQDMKATLNCIKALGVDYTKKDSIVEIKNSEIKAISKEREFNCYESGSTLRFFIPIALVTGDKNIFIGTERLMSRGLEVYENIFKEQGIEYQKTDTCLSINGRLQAGSFNVRGDISSQFISGLLFALPLLKEDSQINITTNLESSGYIDITLHTLKQFGIEIERKENSFYIKGNQQYKATNIDTEADLSNSAFLDAFNILGGDVSLKGINMDSLQADKAYMEYFKMLKEGAPTLDISNCPDLGPILFALSACKNGATFTGTRRLRIKESDRVEAMAKELRKFGVSLEISENSVKVNSDGFKEPNEILCGNNDHRIVMALSVISTIYGGEIDGCEAVSKSYPHFFEDIKRLGIKCEVTE